MDARRENLREEAIYMNHAFSGGPLLREAATEAQRVDQKERYETLKNRHRGWWNN
jgi:hypothetical protein